ncbi:MAG: hypothetical protein GX205_09550 [Firmicutes bacterium]|nr:hypothetical protein [Bacillota bacterium]
MRKLGPIAAALGVVLSLYLVIKGQTMISAGGLTMMMIGLTGLLLNLYVYNRRHR